MASSVRLVLLLAALASWPGAAATEIAIGEQYGQTVASTEADGCKVSLELQLRWQTMRYRNLCDQPIERKAVLFADLLRALFKDGAPPAEVTSLGLGRLVDFPELSAVAALAIRRSGDRDGSKALFRGQTSSEPGARNRFFAEALDRHAVLRPFLDALAPFGVAGGASSVEKVLVGRPAMTPVGRTLREAGVGADEALPFDAQVWLRLRRDGAGTPAK